MIMKQTAVEWLEKEIFKYMQGSNIIDLFNQSKEMEKQQIENAYKHELDNSLGAKILAEQYYIDTFKKD
jgi:hypothetical protein